MPCNFAVWRFTACPLLAGGDQLAAEAVMSEDPIHWAWASERAGIHGFQ